MTHQQGGGIPHAWLLTKHEMFMLHRVRAHSIKTGDRVDCDPHAELPAVSMHHSVVGGEGAAP